MQSSVANTLIFLITAKEEQDDKENKQNIEPEEPKSTSLQKKAQRNVTGNQKKDTHLRLIKSYLFSLNPKILFLETTNLWVLKLQTRHVNPHKR